MRRAKRVGIAMLTGLLASLGLSADPAPDPWQKAIGSWSWSFPRDHGAHPAFKTEWWYFTGNLQDEHQHPFGYQLTIFRQGVQFTPAQAHSKWAVRDFYFGHLTISDLSANQFHVQEKISRGVQDEAGSAEGGMNVKLGSWTIRQQGSTEQFQLDASAEDIGLELSEQPAKPLILEGVGGLSQKAEGAGQASYYYSYPRLTTEGRIRVDGKTYTVKGESWFDHEFSTSSLGKDQVGWDWFCVQMDNHEEVMLYLMRDKMGTQLALSEGTWVRADGNSERLAPGSFTVKPTAFWRSSASGTVYPAGWQITIPAHQAAISITPAIADQELRLSKMGEFDYWEGACRVEGTVADKTVTGVGYTELTGYAASLQGGMQ